MSKNYNFLVIWRPNVAPGEYTVADMKIIDAWSSTSKSIKDARRFMKDNMASGAYRRHGDGFVEVILDNYRSEVFSAGSVKMKTVKSLMTGQPVEIPADTPLCCDPSSETYWSM